jgi:hypothetical protein
VAVTKLAYLEALCMEETEHDALLKSTAIEYARHMDALLNVARATADWLDAIERFRDWRIPIGDTRKIATEAQNRMVAAIAPLLETTDAELPRSMWDER